MKDLYYILGTERNCTQSELQTAYQKLVRKLQPDGQERDHFLENHLQEISEAYHVLSNPDKRCKYDKAYQKNFQRRLYFFKIKYLNVAVTFALLLFTGLFGWYVIKTIGSNKTKTIVKAESEVKTAPVVPFHKSIHHKRKHIPTVPAISKPTVSKTDSVAKTVIKPINTQSDNDPVADQKINNPESSGSTYTVYLKSNLTGIIYLHQSVSYTSPVLAKIPDHSKVTVLEKGPEFYKVAFKNQSGYVPKWAVTNP